MKVGVITIVRVNNYGAELQAFATQKALQMSGYDAEIIDYYYFTNTRHIATKQSKPVFNMPLKLRIVVWLYPWYNRFKRLKGDKQNYKLRERKFEDFHKQYTRFSHEYSSWMKYGAPTAIRDGRPSQYISRACANVSKALTNLRSNLYAVSATRR